MEKICTCIDGIRSTHIGRHCCLWCDITYDEMQKRKASTDPCGTPDRTDTASEVSPFITTFCFLLVKSLSIGIPKVYSSRFLGYFPNSSAWHCTCMSCSYDKISLQLPTYHTVVVHHRVANIVSCGGRRVD